MLNRFRSPGYERCSLKLAVNKGSRQKARKYEENNLRKHPAGRYVIEGIFRPDG